MNLFFCNPETLAIYVLNPRERRKICCFAGHKALCAFDIDQLVCIEATCFELSGPVCILIGARVDVPTVPV